MILICKKKLINYYENQGWILLNNCNVKFLDHKFDIFAMIYCSKSDFKKKFFNKKISLQINN